MISKPQRELPFTSLGEALREVAGGKADDPAAMQQAAGFDVDDAAAILRQPGAFDRCRRSSRSERERRNQRHHGHKFDRKSGPHRNAAGPRFAVFVRHGTSPAGHEVFCAVRNL